MRKATLDAMERRRLTAYRVCKTLGLNLGNVYAYLGKGDVSKVSRNTARRIMEYATG
ncbi:MAG: MFS transporter [Eggerthellaceae bacterium]|nr:MFS transporter [Eggerthellaceae bacterium]